MIHTFLKIGLTMALLCFSIWFLIPAKTLIVQEKPLKKASFIWWLGGESDFWAKDGWAYTFKEEFKKRGYDFKIVSDSNVDTTDYLFDTDVLIIGYPIKEGFKIPHESLKKDVKIYVWGVESPIVMEQPIRQINLDKLEKIFTWRTDLVDHKKTFFVPLDTRLKKNIKIKKDISHKRLLMMQVATGYIGHYDSPQTIYYKRLISSLWWIKNHPTDYEVYGNRWDKIGKELPDDLKPSFKHSYKGYAKDKIKTLSEARFALAFENTRHNDYVSEKIYDVMRAGTVPVYLGAPNIEQFVPKECFINYANFESDEQLYDFLKTITPEQYQGYLTCIQNFLDSDKINTLTAKYAAQIMIKEIFN